jgi:hypothetical protein
MDGDAPRSTRPSRTSAATEIGIRATMTAQARTTLNGADMDGFVDER